MVRKEEHQCRHPQLSEHRKTSRCSPRCGRRKEFSSTGSICCSAPKLDAERRDKALIFIDSEESNEDTEQHLVFRFAFRGSRLPGGGAASAAYGGLLLVVLCLSFNWIR